MREATLSKSIYVEIIPGLYIGIQRGYNLNILFHNGNQSENIELTQGIRGTSIELVEVYKDGTIECLGQAECYGLREELDRCLERYRVPKCEVFKLISEKRPK